MKKPLKTGRTLLDGFYKLVPAFDPKNATMSKVPEGGTEFVVHGAIQELVFITVPEHTTEQAREALGALLTEHGISCIVVSEKVQYMKVRRCSRREEETYRAEVIRAEEASAKEREKAIRALAERGLGDGAGPVADGNRDRDLPDGRDAGSRGDGEHREGDGDQETHGDS